MDAVSYMASPGMDPPQRVSPEPPERSAMEEEEQQEEEEGCLSAFAPAASITAVIKPIASSKSSAFICAGCAR